jgi:antitoxin component YwqK of YwqJK toxin-antitoxin module
MKNTLLPLLVLIGTTLQAQLYYKDIMGTRETNRLMKIYRANRVSSVLLQASDPDGTRTEGFNVSQRMTDNYSKLVTVTGSGTETGSVLTSMLDEQGRVKETIDSSERMINQTIYSYTDSGALLSVTSISTDSSQTLNEKEEHLWQYDENGRPIRMVRKVNGKEVSDLTFKLDDTGNVIEEQASRNGVPGEVVYYYYDARNLLTDIVRYNTKAHRLLPDYLFEYGGTGQLIQKITLPGNNSDYLIWRYQYDSNGLKTREAIFNKQKQLTGKIEYSYTFNQ